MAYVPKFCAHCKDDLADWNDTGYCSRTAECRRKGQRVYQGKDPDATLPVCLNCGEYTNGKYGYCRRTEECRRLREEVRHGERYAASPSYDCLVCGASTRSEFKICANSAACLAAKYLAKKRECLEAYGGARCACCGEDKLYFLTLDHVDGDGAEDRKKLFTNGTGSSDGRPRGNQYQALRSLGYPARDKYQVLCFNCNCAKGTKTVCPCYLERES